MNMDVEIGLIIIKMKLILPLGPLKDIVDMQNSIIN
jgi:hypothetical protein